MNLSYRILLACCLAGLLIGCRDDGGGAVPGSIAKDFRLDTLGHDRFYLNQNRGKVVVLLFWDTQCSLCKREMIDLKSLQDAHGSEKLVVAAVCTDPENIDEVRSIVKELGIDYPVLLDRGADVSRKYGVVAFPTTVVIDKAGYISLAGQGYSAVIVRRVEVKVAGALGSNASSE